MTRLFRLAFAAAFALASGPAAAATMKATFIGTVAAMVDLTNTFGAGLSGPLGSAASIVFIYDSEKGSVVSNPLSFERAGGTLLGSEGPIISVMLDVDGTVIDLPFSELNSLTRASQPFPLARFDALGLNIGPDAPFSSSATTLIDTAVAAEVFPIPLDLTQPFERDFLPVLNAAQAYASYSRAGTATQAAIDFTLRIDVTRVTIAPVPLPAGGFLLLGALGLMVAVRRSRAD